MAATPPQGQDGEAITKDVDLLAREVEKLRLAYDQYFLGLQKDEPLKTKALVTKLLGKLAGTAVQNARLKFRLQQTVARYNTFSTYWSRMLKDIEEGRAQRDVFRATLHEKERFGQFKGQKVADATAGAAAQAPKAPVDPFAQLFAQFIDARKKCNESVAGLTVESFTKTMTTQLAALKQKTPAASFKFQVAVEGGKTKIKAIPQAAPKSTK